MIASPCVVSITTHARAILHDYGETKMPRHDDTDAVVLDPENNIVKIRSEKRKAGWAKKDAVKKKAPIADGEAANANPKKKGKTFVADGQTAANAATEHGEMSAQTKTKGRRTADDFVADMEAKKEGKFTGKKKSDVKLDKARSVKAKNEAVGPDQMTLRDWCAKHKLDPRKGRAFARKHRDELKKLEVSGRKYVYPKSNETKLNAIMKEAI
jgi:hypothetical protein